MSITNVSSRNSRKPCCIFSSLSVCIHLAAGRNLFLLFSITRAPIIISLYTMCSYHVVAMTRQLLWFTDPASEHGVATFPNTYSTLAIRAVTKLSKFLNAGIWLQFLLSSFDSEVGQPYSCLCCYTVK